MFFRNISKVSLTPFSRECNRNRYPIEEVHVQVKKCYIYNAVANLYVIDG